MSILSEDFLPLSYRGENFPRSPNPFNRECDACSLSCKEAVGGVGPDNFNDIKLIVISDYVGAYELKCGYPMYENDKERAPKTDRFGVPRSLPGWKNAGALLRSSLNELYGLDTYNDCYITNALKCDPKSVKPTAKHIKVCVIQWLLDELAMLDEQCPSVPILVAGTQAFNALKMIDSTLNKELTGGLQKYRRTNHYRLKQHPLVFTFNPAAVARNEGRIETDIQRQHNFRVKVTEVQQLPVFVGSPLWHFKRDLMMLDQFLHSRELL